MAIGYDPTQYTPAGSPAQSIEQWVADMAAQWTVAYANGSLDFDKYPVAFSNDFWATLGLPPLPQDSFGATKANPNNTINPGVHSGLLMFFNQIATNPASAAKAGFTVPELPSRGPIMDDKGRDHAFADAQNQAQNKNQLDQIALQNQGAMDRQNANNQFLGQQGDLERAHEMAVTNLEQSGMDRRQAEELANRMSIAQLQEAGQDSRNAARIAADLQMAAQTDATNRYGIDTNAAVQREDLAGRERIATGDRVSRETIAGADRAESARQFDMNLAEDRRQFNSTALLDLFDRGIELMKNPVDWVAYQYYMENLSIPLDALNYSAMASSLGAMPPTGPSELGAMRGGPAIVDGDFAAAQQVGVTPGFVSMQEAIQANPGNPSQPSAVAGQTTAEASATWGDMTQLQGELDKQRMTAINETMDPNNPIVQQIKQQYMSAGPTPMGGGQPTNSNPAASLPPVGGTTASLYTGAQSATPAAGSSTTAPMEQLIKQMAQNLGMDEAQLWKMSGAGSMTPAYSKDAIANAPVMQALRNGAQSMSQFRTALGPSTASPSAQATGPGLGLRGGQDMNAGLLLNNTPGNQGLIQGAVMADGHDWDTFAKQSLKASPVTQYETGVFGRRR